jgi:hypothetical protein
MPPKSTIPAVGSRRQVYGGFAKHTSGGLVKSDLIKNKFGEIVSKKASLAAKKRFREDPDLRASFQENRRENPPKNGGRGLKKKK